MRYIVNVSGGATSFEALRRTINRYGTANTVAVFADTRIEDADLYRFLDDTERHFGITITRLADGRTPFDVWRDDRAMTIPNGAVPCSNRLKREVINAWLEGGGVTEPYTLVFGMDWSEPDRMDRLRERYAPTPCWFPLAEKPYVDKADIIANLRRLGIKVPALYEEGFAHNNCGGGCVKAGMAAFAHLLKMRPATFARWEAEEAAFQAFIGKPVTLLKDRRGGTVKRLSLKELRERVECGGSIDATDWGGCGCFASGQLAMDL